MSEEYVTADEADEKICANCRFWFRTLLQCRRHAPTAKYWPMTSFSEWCGDWEKVEHMPFGGRPDERG